MNREFLSTRDLAIAYLYGVRNDAVFRGISQYPYCPIAQSWMHNSKVKGSLRALRQKTAEGDIETAFEFPRELFNSYAIDEVGLKGCLSEVVDSACRRCIFSKALPSESMPSLILNTAEEESFQIDLRPSAEDFSVEWHNQDFQGEALCQALIGQASYNVIMFSELTRRRREILVDYPAIITRVNPQLEALIFNPQIHLGEIPALDFKCSRLKAGTHHMVRR